MNAYFDKNDCFNSNSRIIEAYFTETARRQSTADRVVKTLLSVLAVILSALTSARARCIFKVLSVAVCFVGFVGIIGAMEQGTIGLGAGFLIGMLLIGVEFICLRSRQK